MLLPKPKRIKSEKYKAWVRKLPCVICGNIQTDPHHQQKKGEGKMGGKADDTRCIPLCLAHHTGGGTPQHPGDPL